MSKKKNKQQNIMNKNNSVNCFTLPTRSFFDEVDDRYEKLCKSLTMDTRQISSDSFNRLIKDLKCVIPPFDRSILATLYDADGTHGSCISLKADTACARGYAFRASPESRRDEAKFNKIKKWAETSVNGQFGYTLRSLIEEIALSLALYDEYFLEITSLHSGESVDLRLTPCDTKNMYIAPKYDARGNPLRGIVDKYVQISVNANTVDEGIVWDAYTGKNKENIPNRAVFHDKFPSHLSDYYGTAKYTSAIKYVVENNYISDFNSNFFKNGAKISYGLFVTGQDLSDKQEAELSKKTQGSIGVNQAHKMFTLNMGSKDAKINLQEMSKPYEGSFMDLRASNRDFICVAHRTSSRLLGLQGGGGNIGGGSEDMSALVKYIQTVVNKFKKKIEDGLNSILSNEFGFNPKLELLPPDITNQKDKAVVMKTLFETVDEYGNRVINIEQIRDALKIEQTKMKTEVVNEDFLSVDEKLKKGIISNSNESSGVHMNSSGDIKDSSNNLREYKDDITETEK